jgi:predicted transcriptional regulator
MLTIRLPDEVNNRLKDLADKILLRKKSDPEKS